MYNNCIMKVNTTSMDEIEVKYPTNVGDGPGWKFRPAPDGFVPNPNFVVAFNLFQGDKEEYDKTIEYWNISDNKEDYQRCIHRERCMEIAACRHYGVPYMFIVENREAPDVFSPKCACHGHHVCSYSFF